MAAFDPNDEVSFFDSAMAELNGNQATIQNEDGEFVDAPEHQFDHGLPMDDFTLELSNSLAASGDCDEAYLPSTLDPEIKIDSQSGDEILAAPEPKGKQRQNLMPYYNPAVEPEETINVSKQSASEKHTAAYLSIFAKPATSSQGEHSAGCSDTRSASTPPATPPHQPGSAPKTDTKLESKPNLPHWAGPDDLRDLPRAFVREKRWHEKVAHLHPSYALPSHRYWIGILNPGLVARTACKESHFTWMKGNKYTTVETVRRVYATVTMKEGVLIMGGEKPNDEDRVDSLDLFNDKIVLFTIVDEHSPLALGRKITEGLVTQELVELDD
jgi:hypothetical protein